MDDPRPEDDRRPEKPDLSYPRRVHIVGAGGAGMSAIGLVLLSMGHRVTGSDAATSANLSRLSDQGAVVHAGHDRSWIEGADVVAKSTAIPDDNVELVEAERRGVRVWRRSELLAAICAERRVIAVSGTHGKTTTSSLLFFVLRHAGLHPSMIVGGDIAGIGPGAVWDPAGEWLVVEADESDGTFLDLGAEAVVVTSVEPDHLDYYGSEDSMREAFVRFAESAPGPIVLCADDDGARDLARRLQKQGAGGRILTYGLSSGADVVIDEPRLDRGSSLFLLRQGGERIGPFALAAPGLYNLRNAAAALTTGHLLGATWEQGATGVGAYRGVARRFETRGERGGVTFVDDYGHLPGEVASVLAAARAGGWERIVAVFQPHRFSRTQRLWPSFADAFVGADVVLLTDVYAAGEAPRPGVSGELIFAAVRDAHPEADVRYLPSLDAVVEELARVLRPGDLCLTLGAGDVTSLPARMLREPGAA